MSEKAKRRLSHIRVNEISLVDKPAVKEEFYVTKKIDPTVSPAPTEVPVAKAEGEMPEAAPVTTVATPVHDALIGEKIALVKAQIDGLMASMAAGEEMDDLRDRVWKINDALWSLLSLAVAVQKRDGDVIAAVKAVEVAKSLGRPGTVDVEKSAGGKMTKPQVDQMVKAIKALAEVAGQVDVEKSLSALADGGTDVPEVGDANPTDFPSGAIELTKRLGDMEAKFQVELTKRDEALAKANAQAAEAKSQVVELEKRINAAGAVSKSLTGDASPEPTGKKGSIWDGAL